jgi:hypothetical protein
VGVRVAFAVLAIALSWAGPSSAQSAQSTGQAPAAAAEVFTSFTPDEVAAILRDAGYRAQIEHKDNTYSIVTGMGGYTVVAWLICDNNSNKCDSLDWDIAFNASPTFTLELANKWNREKRYAKAYIATNGRFFIEYSMEFSGGVTRQAVAQSARRFDSLCSEFESWSKSD